MKRLSFILLILCIFFTGCKTQPIDNTDTESVADGTSVLTQIYETDAPPQNRLFRHHSLYIISM